MIVQVEKGFPNTPYIVIPLKHGRVILVDPDRYGEFRKYHWFLKWSGFRAYACRSVTVDGKKKFIRMHRVVADTPDDMVCHHINKNPLDNRRANLQNMTWFDHTKMHSWR